MINRENHSNFELLNRQLRDNNKKVAQNTHNISTNAEVLNKI